MTKDPQNFCGDCAPASQGRGRGGFVAWKSIRTYLMATWLIALLAAAPSVQAQSSLLLGNIGNRRHPPRRVVVHLPPIEPGHETDPRPVLYVLDGELARDTFHIPETIATLVQQDRIDRWIVVAIDSTSDRTREYASEALRFADFVVDVVAPQVEQHFAIRPGRESRAILGYSYGGLAALQMQMGRPEYFGRVIAMSPSLWYRRGAANRAFRRSRALLPHRMWIDVGGREGRENDAIPYMVADARALRDAAIARGMVFGRDVGYDEVVDEAHDMAAAGRRMHAALAFALSRPDAWREGPSRMWVETYRYADASRSVPFVVHAEYESGVRLAWPPTLVHLQNNAGDRVTDDLLRPHRFLRIRGFPHVSDQLPDQPRLLP